MSVKLLDFFNGISFFRIPIWIRKKYFHQISLDGIKENTHEIYK